MSIELVENFDVKEYVRELCRLGVKSSSASIANFLQRKGHTVSSGTVAAIKAAYARNK